MPRREYILFSVYLSYQFNVGIEIASDGKLTSNDLRLNFRELKRYVSVANSICLNPAINELCSIPGS